MRKGIDMKHVDFDINGVIPGRPRAGADLVVYEKGGDPMDGYVLYGFDEVGMFEEEFKVPQYCFC